MPDLARGPAARLRTGAHARSGASCQAGRACWSCPCARPRTWRGYRPPHAPDQAIRARQDVRAGSGMRAGSAVRAESGRLLTAGPRPDPVHAPGRRSARIGALTCSDLCVRPTKVRAWLGVSAWLGARPDRDAYPCWHTCLNRCVDLADARARFGSATPPSPRVSRLARVPVWPWYTRPAESRMSRPLHALLQTAPAPTPRVPGRHAPHVTRMPGRQACLARRGCLDRRVSRSGTRSWLGVRADSARVPSGRRTWSELGVPWDGKHAWQPACPDRCVSDPLACLTWCACHSGPRASARAGLVRPVRLGGVRA